VTVTFCFHNSALSFFILNELFDMLQYQETLLWIHKSCITSANPNKYEQTRVYVRIDARAPISSGHGMVHNYKLLVHCIDMDEAGQCYRTICTQ